MEGGQSLVQVTVQLLVTLNVLSGLVDHDASLDKQGGETRILLKHRDTQIYEHEEYFSNLDAVHLSLDTIGLGLL